MEPTFVRFMNLQCPHCVNSISDWAKFTKMKLPVKAVEIGRKGKIFEYNGKEYSYDRVPTYVLFNGDNTPAEYHGTINTPDDWLSFIKSKLKKGDKRWRTPSRRRSRGRRGRTRTRAARSSF